MKIFLAITGSIAAYRIPNLVSQLRKQGHVVKTAVSRRATSFVAPQALAVMSGHPCLQDNDEWHNAAGVTHIELAKWCDACLVAPLSAHTLAKIANGLCDNLITSAIRALGDKPLLLAPAMNTRMWENALTQTQLKQAGKFYKVTIIPPIEKLLADGDEGMGALAEDVDLLDAVNSIFKK